MDNKAKEKGILKMEIRPKAGSDQIAEMVTQSSLDRPPLSPQPSVDRLSVTWAEPASMASSGVNLFHLPSETPCSNEIRFSPSAGDGSEDEDYSASLSAVLRQRRASVRRSRKGRVRRPSSPFLADEARSRRRSSVFTTSSGDTAISLDDVQPTVVTQEQIFENIHLHKEVLGSVKQQPLGMRRKLKIVHQAKAYIKRHEGQLQERLAQSKSTRDIYARFNILMTTKWQQVKREAANMSNILIPWELRIKEIESHFGSVVASYFTFLRWLFWVNLVIAFILLVFVIVPECLTANETQDGQRKTIMEEERQNSTKLLTLWEFEGVLKVSPIFYGYYSNIEKPEYRMPLAYFLTGLVVYIYSFVAILRKMAENSRMSKLSEKEDECIFSWKLFTGWDFMIGNTETAHNRIASVILGFKEALLEEAEKKKDLRNWRIIFLRVFVNICVIILLAVSAYAVVTVVSRSDDKGKSGGWWSDNETTIVVTVISITFPVFFELLGFLEHYHPRKQLRLQLAKIMLLNLLNLYSLIFALFTKIEGMSLQLDALKPTLYSENITEALASKLSSTCVEVRVSCLPCDVIYGNPTINPNNKFGITPTVIYNHQVKSIANGRKTNTKTYVDNTKYTENLDKFPIAENLIKNETNETNKSILIGIQELERLRNISKMAQSNDPNETNEDSGSDDYIFEETDNITKTTAESISTAAFTKVFNKMINLTDTDTTYNVTFEIVNKSISIDNNIIDTSEISELETTNSVITVQPHLKDNVATEINSTYTDMKNYTFDAYAPPFTTESYMTSFYTDSNVISTTPANETISKPIKNEFDTDILSTISSDATSQDSLTPNDTDLTTTCPDFSFNCTVQCDDLNITQTFVMSNCMIVERKCYEKKCENKSLNGDNSHNATMNLTADFIFYDVNNVKMYNLTKDTQKKLLTLCWETMFGQELVKLTMMDLVFVVLGTLFMDFFRALFVRYMNQFWCWDLEKKFPEYGDFKIAENILHLINNQGMVWMGMFFSPGLVVLNVFKLAIMMYLRSWAVMTCNVPHEVIFRVSKSNNFYLALLLTMLFLCVLPVGYSIVWVKPSWHCGPFSEYGKIYQILTNNIYKILPKSLNFTLEYITSPAIVIPMLVLLILIIYYLTSLTNSLREANNDLKIQLRRERTEERRKMFQIADNRRRTGSAIDNTPYARWKRALPALPFSKSIDSDDRKTITGDDNNETQKVTKKKGGIFAKIVSMALDTKVQIQNASKIHFDTSQSINNLDDETDTDFHETLPKEVLKIKDITIIKNNEKDKRRIEFKTDSIPDQFYDQEQPLKIATDITDENKEIKEDLTIGVVTITPVTNESLRQDEDSSIKIQVVKDNTEYNIPIQSYTSIIPVITISKTESDEEITQAQREEKEKAISKEQIEKIKDEEKTAERNPKITHTTDLDVKFLRRQNSIDSTKEPRIKKPEDGHKYQYSL